LEGHLGIEDTTLDGTEMDDVNRLILTHVVAQQQKQQVNGATEDDVAAKIAEGRPQAAAGESLPESAAEAFHKAKPSAFVAALEIGKGVPETAEAAENFQKDVAMSKRATMEDTTILNALSLPDGKKQKTAEATDESGEWSPVEDYEEEPSTGKKMRLTLAPPPVLEHSIAHLSSAASGNFVTSGIKCPSCLRGHIKRCRHCQNCAQCAKKTACVRPMTPSGGSANGGAPELRSPEVLFSPTMRTRAVLGPRMDQAVFAASTTGDFEKGLGLCEAAPAFVNFQRTEAGMSSLLMVAASKGRVDVIRDLLAKGADPHLKDTKGRQAVEWARLRHQAEAQELLAKAMRGDLARERPSILEDSEVGGRAGNGVRTEQRREKANGKATRSVRIITPRAVHIPGVDTPTGITEGAGWPAGWAGEEEREGAGAPAAKLDVLDAGEGEGGEVVGKEKTEGEQEVIDLS
jgi:hypothetical protein